MGVGGLHWVAGGVSVVARGGVEGSPEGEFPQSRIPSRAEGRRATLPTSPAPSGRTGDTPRASGAGREARAEARLQKKVTKNVGFLILLLTKL